MFNGFYTPVDEAREILDSRGESVRKSVEKWWEEYGIDFPSFFNEVRPCAIMARNIPTFRYEDAVFVKMAESCNLNPCWTGYSEDLMVNVSSVKTSLLQPVFATRMGRKGGVVLEKKKLACPKRCNGMKLSEIVCNNGGGKLQEFHFNHLLSLYPEAHTWDFSSKAKELGGRSHRYYAHFLSLAVAHGVLFEDYHGGESGGQLDSFTAGVFEPAFRKVEEIFGHSPVIVKMPWYKELSYYPSEEFVDYEKTSIPWREHPFVAQIESDNGVD